MYKSYNIQNEHFFQIVDDIINTKKFLSYYSQHRGYIKEHFRSKEEEDAVDRGNEGNYLYRRYRLRDKEYCVSGAVVSDTRSQPLTLIKHKSYICDIKLHYNAQCSRYFPFIENIRSCCRRAVSEFIDEDD